MLRIVTNCAIAIGVGFWWVIPMVFIRKKYKKDSYTIMSNQYFCY